MIISSLVKSFVLTLIIEYIIIKLLFIRKKVFIPVENERDLDDIPENIRNDIEFIKVKNYMEVYKELFGEK